MSAEINLIVLIEVLPGKSQAQVEAYNELLPVVLAEPGCLQYELKEVAGSDVDFVLIEKWASEEALARHGNTPHMIAAKESNTVFRAKPATVLRLNDL